MMFKLFNLFNLFKKKPSEREKNLLEDFNNNKILQVDNNKDNKEHFRIIEGLNNFKKKEKEEEEKKEKEKKEEEKKEEEEHWRGVDELIYPK